MKAHERCARDQALRLAHLTAGELDVLETITDKICDDNQPVLHVSRSVGRSG